MRKANFSYKYLLKGKTIKPWNMLVNLLPRTRFQRMTRIDLLQMMSVKPCGKVPLSRQREAEAWLMEDLIKERRSYDTHTLILRSPSNRNPFEFFRQRGDFIEGKVQVSLRGDWSKEPDTLPTVSLLFGVSFFHRSGSSNLIKLPLAGDCLSS